MSDELARLTARLPLAELGSLDTLRDAGNELGIEWPADYVHVISRHNGVEGEVGPWWLVLNAVEGLADQMSSPMAEFLPGLVVIGGDGADEALAIDRETHEILLVPWIGGKEDWLVLGATLTEALQRMERDDVYSAPHRYP